MSVGRAREVTTEIKAAYLAGLYSGSNLSKAPQAKAWRAEFHDVCETAALIAFGDGVFNPLDIWRMENAYDRVVTNCEKSP